MQLKFRIRYAVFPGACVLSVAVALLVLGAPVARAQDQNSFYSDPCMWLMNCAGNPAPGGQPNRPQGPSYDPCYLAQNALRPCTPQQSPAAAKPAGVDPHIVGTWELAQASGIWVLEIHRDGTYRFHSEGGNGAAPNAGTFSASNGHWALRATNGYADGGTYVFQPPGTWIATGNLGTAAWRQRGPKVNVVKK